MPELMDELVEEVLVRFPPDDPASLVHAALVCKRWCRLVSATAFRRRFREFHVHRRAAPPLLGVLYTSTTEGDCCHKQQQEVIRDDGDDTDEGCIKRARILPEPTACFVPTACSFRPGPAHAANSRLRYGWRAIDARHGRVLLRRSAPSLTYGHGLCVWDPVTDELLDLPEPSFSKTAMVGYNWTAAVVCAATAASGNCDHLDCHRGHFLVIIMDVQDHVIRRAVYSSETGAWSHLDALPRADRAFSFREFKQTPSVLVGSALYFLVHCNDEVVEYELATQDVSIIYMPSEFYGLLEQRGVVLMTDDNGGLGFVASSTSSDHQLELWSSVNGGEGGFVQTRVIDLQKVLIPSSSSSDGALPALINNSLRVNGFGFADGGATATRFLFMRTSDGLCSIDINSSHVKKIANCCVDDEQDNVIVPYISFCTPNSFVTATPSTSALSYDHDQVPRRSNRTRRPNPRWTGREWTSYRACVNCI